MGLPSGKHTSITMENHHFLKMGKSTISTGPFSIAMLNYQRVSQKWLSINDLNNLNGTPKWNNPDIPKYGVVWKNVSAPNPMGYHRFPPNKITIFWGSMPHFFFHIRISTTVVSLSMKMVGIFPTWHRWYSLYILFGGLEHFLFFHILGRIIPTDEVIFFRGLGIPPTRYIYINKPL